MLKVHGREVLETLAEIADPAHTALLIIDVQHDFCSPDGLYGSLGKDLAMFPPAVARIRTAIAAARDAGVLPIWIRNRWLPRHRAASGPWLRFMVVRNGMDPERGCTVDGTWGAEILPEVAPGPDDLIVDKWRSSAFIGTNLDMVLRDNGIRTVICTGVVTQGCVESTARDAAFMDYYVVVVEDAVATYEQQLQDASLTVLRTRVDVAPLDDVLGVWSGGNRRRE
jgi:nicotinamidase-related amidase